MFFPSKKDLLFWFLLWGSALLMILPGIIALDLITFLVMAPWGLALIWLWYTTGYLIEEDTLIVKFGPFKKKININNIRSLSKTKNLLSSPALSLDRIEVTYNNYDFIYISPLHQKEFIQFLLNVNPKINLDEKLEKENS
ncbi:PH domain-containing protein [Bacillaceae bacterium W0354]